jgi:hypothetical protein
MPPPSNSAADVGAARAEVASARAQSGIGKVDLGECEDQTAYGKLETICGDAYPHLSILGHRLHDSLDIDIFTAGIKPMVEKQAVTCAKVRGLLFQVKRSRGKEKRLSDNRDSGIMQGLAGNTVFGINNMLNKNSSDWTRNATSWGKLVGGPAASHSYCLYTTNTYKFYTTKTWPRFGSYLYLTCDVLRILHASWPSHKTHTKAPAPDC